MQQRRAARENLTDFAKYVNIPGVPVAETSADIDTVTDHDYKIVETELADHHLLTLDTLDALIDNRLTYWLDDDGAARDYERDPPPDNRPKRICKRVMLMEPPGSAKSTYGSVVFPSYVMGKYPHSELILTGYGDVICRRHGKRTRQLCSSVGYRSVFGVGVDKNTRAAEDWNTENGSNYKTSGILSGITGFRCSGLIWDDITKGRKEADSQGIRNDTYNAYIDDARSRKTPNAWELAIGTRWHEDETMGRILPESYAGESGFMVCRDGNIWYVICLPAECEREDDPLGRDIGEMLWPEWFTENYWDDKRVNPRSWASLYQQRPAPEEGIYFKRDWFRTYTDLPKNLNKYISFDPAVTESEDADQTAIEVWAIDDSARVYLVDEWVGRVTMDVWIAQLITMVAIHKPIEVISESGVIRRASEPYLKREMQQRGIYAMFEWVTRNADKSAMARPYQAMVSSGNVYYPANSIGDKTTDELLRFPAGKDDHRVDAGANFFLRLERIWAANPPMPAEKKEGPIDHSFKVAQIMPDRFPKKQSRWKRR